MNSIIFLAYYDKMSVLFSVFRLHLSMTSKFQQSVVYNTVRVVDITIHLKRFRKFILHYMLCQFCLFVGLSFVLVCFFYMHFYFVAQTVLKLTSWPRVALTSVAHFLSSPTAGIISMHHYTCSFNRVVDTHTHIKHTQRTHIHEKEEKENIGGNMVWIRVTSFYPNSSTCMHLICTNFALIISKVCQKYCSATFCYFVLSFD